MKALIFDLDGTLINSLDDLADAINMMLTERGYPTQPREVFPLYIGDGVRSLVERALPPEALETLNIDACVADYQRCYHATWNQKTRPYPGIFDMLTALKLRGLKVGVLSNKPHAFTVLCCDHFFPENTFDFVLGARDTVPRKPHPAGALEIAEIFGVLPSECAYIGDSGIDMETGVRAGMLPVGVLWGFRGEEELRAKGAQKLVSKAAEIVEMVGVL